MSMTIPEIEQDLFDAFILRQNPETVWLSELYRELAHDRMDRWIMDAYRAPTRTH